MTEQTLTLATPSNMRAFAEANPSRTVTLPDGLTATIEGRRCMAVSLNGPDECSATAGDYWNLPDDEPLRDSDGEPMVLAVQETRYLDAMTGELL